MLLCLRKIIMLCNALCRLIARTRLLWRADKFNSRSSLGKSMPDLHDAIAKLSRLIRHLAAQVKSRQELPVFSLGVQSDFVSFSDERLGGLELTNDDASEYRATVEGVYAAVSSKSEHISQAAVESFVQEGILAAVDPVGASEEKDFEKRLASALKELSAQLRKEPSLREVHFLVDGISKDNLPHSFGTCEFYFGDETSVARLAIRVRKIFDSLQRKEHVEWAKNEAVDKIRSLIMGKTGVVAAVYAVDSNAAHVLAKRTARQAVDILNFYANLGGNPPSEVSLFSEGRGSGVLSTFLLSDELPSYSAPSERFGPYIPFSFAAEYLDKAGFGRMSDMLGKRKERTEIEDRLISAFQCAGRASVEPRKEAAFLWFAIALESLLSDRNDSSEITEKLALRGAHLIARNIKSRQTVYKNLKRLYRIRSRVVHSGSVEVGESQLSEIRFYSRVALLTMLCSTQFAAMCTDDDITDWFRSKLLDTGSDTEPAGS